jgi:hypothetical protein
MKLNPSLKTINEFYFSRLIDSLEKDYEKWEMHHFAGAGFSWTDYYSPAYENDEGIIIKFTLDGIVDGAYINGTLKWHLSIFRKYNVFSIKTIRFWKAYRKMKNHLVEKEVTKIKEELINSL